MKGLIYGVPTIICMCLGMFLGSLKRIGSLFETSDTKLRTACPFYRKYVKGPDANMHENRRVSMNSICCKMLNFGILSKLTSYFLLFK